MSVDSLGVRLDRQDSVMFWASRTEETACLVFKADGSHCEITMARENVEALRDQLPEVLAGLDRVAVEEVACGRAHLAERRALDAAGQALEVAAAAEAAGATDLAASLRAAVAETTEKANAVNESVRAFEQATVEVDSAAWKLVSRTGNVESALAGLVATTTVACTERGGLSGVEVASA